VKGGQTESLEQPHVIAGLERVDEREAECALEIVVELGEQHPVARGDQRLIAAVPASTESAAKLIV
jgi:hypothetical protein